MGIAMGIKEIKLFLLDGEKEIPVEYETLIPNTHYIYDKVSEEYKKDPWVSAIYIRGTLEERTVKKELFFKDYYLKILHDQKIKKHL